ncbi:MAG: VOC family protein [Alphaproteobacteria bacterium]|nr:VOC family protein [Alphaproteobacteria bacterium]
MSVVLNPYLHFKDVARDAMTFYHQVLGGELTVSTYGDFNPAEGSATRDRIMHAMLKTPGGLVLMGGDIPDHVDYRPSAGFSVSLSGPFEDGEELHRYWDGLAAGGTIAMPLATAPWGDEFGMVTDRFGVDWMVNIAGKTAG